MSRVSGSPTFRGVIQPYRENLQIVKKLPMQAREGTTVPGANRSLPGFDINFGDSDVAPAKPICRRNEPAASHRAKRGLTHLLGLTPDKSPSLIVIPRRAA